MANDIPNNSTVKSALLIAAANVGDENIPTALLDIGGEPLIAHQIAQLKNNGIERFYIEVEELPGALVAMTERLRAQGLNINYVRAPGELSGILNKDELLLIVCDGIIADNGLIKEIISTPSRYIVTLDSREENSLYERIDLNSHWAGIALLDEKSVSAIASLPEGWSIRSSLLRQALQDAVPHRPLNQELVTAKQLRRIKSHDEAKELGKEILGVKARGVSGIIERKIFAPISAALAPMMWKSPVASNALQFALPLFSVSSLAAALSGLAPVAAILAIVSLFIYHLKSLLHNNDKQLFISNIMSYGMWGVLASAFVFVAWKDVPQPYAVIFPPLVALGLLLLARKLPLSGWRKELLSSPALLAIAAFSFSLIDQFVIGIELFALAQLAGLIFPVNFHDKT